MKTISKILTATFLASGLVSNSFANLPFTISPSFLGSSEADVEVTGVEGSYDEAIVVRPPTSLGAPITFDVGIVLDFSTFTGIPSRTSTGLFSDYGLYAILMVSGEVVGDPAGDFTLGNFSGSANVYGDPSFDTVLPVGNFATQTGTFMLDGAGQLVLPVSGNTDDILLANTFDPLTGLSELSGGVNGGSQASSSSFFINSSTFNLTNAGENFFVEPDPFYNMLFSTGDISNLFDLDFSDTSSIINTIQYFENTATVTFKVSEPSSIAFLGLGLFAAGFLARRK